jgi:hypothetical protein
MAEPTKEEQAAAFTALVDLIIDQAREQGEALTRDEADTRAKNLLKNAADPYYKSIEDRVTAIENHLGLGADGD